MSTQYTNQAKTAVKYAEKTARRYKHSYIGTEHLLAGLYTKKRERPVWFYATWESVKNG